MLCNPAPKTQRPKGLFHRKMKAFGLVPIADLTFGTARYSKHLVFSCFFHAFPIPPLEDWIDTRGGEKPRKFSVNDKVFADIARRVEALYQPEIY